MFEVRNRERERKTPMTKYNEGDEDLLVKCLKSETERERGRHQ